MYDEIRRVQDRNRRTVERADALAAINEETRRRTEKVFEPARLLHARLSTKGGDVPGSRNP